MLEQVRKQGKIRYYGISTNNLQLISTMVKEDMIHVIQYHSNLMQEAKNGLLNVPENWH